MPALDIIKQAGEGLLKGVSDIVGKFKADPTKIAELEAEAQKLVLSHNEKMADLAQRELEAGNADRDSARKREIGLAGTIGVYVQNGCAVFIIVIFAVMLVLVMSQEIPAANKDLIHMTLGALFTMVITIVNYWFGSSQGSATKERQINEIIKTINK